MSHRARIEEVIRYIGRVDPELITSLRDEGLFPEDEVSSEEAEELRVAIVLMRDMGVNAAGVEVILRMRHRLMTLQSRTEEALHLLLDEQH